MCRHTELLVSSVGAINDTLQPPQPLLPTFFPDLSLSLSLWSKAAKLPQHLSLSLSLSVLHMYGASTKLHTWAIKANINQSDALRELTNTSLLPKNLYLLPEQRFIKGWILWDAKSAPQGAQARGFLVEPAHLSSMQEILLVNLEMGSTSACSDPWWNS